MIEKTIQVGGREVSFKASAAIPRIYRAKFGRDIFQDLVALEGSLKATGEGEQFAIGDLEVFENVAYAMASHADPSVPKDIDEWLSDFDMFSIYEVLPEILALWGENMAQLSDAKKK